MPAIGYVAAHENGTFKGQLKTLSIRAEITITPNARKANDVQSDFPVYSGDVEIGAGWNRRSEASGNEYVSLSLAAPEFGPRRLYANLARAADDQRDDRFVILWNPADCSKAPRGASASRVSCYLLQLPICRARVTQRAKRTLVRNACVPPHRGPGDG